MRHLTKKQFVTELNRIIQLRFYEGTSFDSTYKPGIVEDIAEALEKMYSDDSVYIEILIK